MRNLVCTGLIAVLAAAPSAAFGQACIGMPIGPGQFAIGAELQLPEGGRTWLGTFNANLAAPIAFRAAAGLTTIDDVEENATNVEGLAAYRLIDNERVSACPVVGVRHFRLSAEDVDGEATIRQTLVPIGFGVGTTLATGGLGVTLYAFPHYLYVRSGLDVSDGDSSISLTASDSEFGADLGVRIGTARLFAGAGMNITSIEDTDPVFSFSVGVGLGRRR